MKKRKKTMKTNYNKALDNLLVGIGNDYDRWNNVDYLDDEVLDSDNKRMKEIKTKSAIKFKEGLRVKPGRKFDKIMHGTSVWGFVAKKNGEHKGIPYFTGDVFKAATWRAPAKHVRGSIFYDGSDWYAWTGPNYL
jgi:hypothetical protein